MDRQDLRDSWEGALPWLYVPSFPDNLFRVLFLLLRKGLYPETVPNSGPDRPELK